MAFREFRYLGDALPGLLELKRAGVPKHELLERIRTVMAGSRPTARGQHVVPFRGHYLVFVALGADPGVLVLAAVHKQPA